MKEFLSANLEFIKDMGVLIFMDFVAFFFLFLPEFKKRIKGGKKFESLEPDNND